MLLGNEHGSLGISGSQPLKFHGGKSYSAKWIHGLAPSSCVEDPEHGYTHRNIAFAGGLGEFWNWLPIEGVSEAINDKNGQLSNFWEVLASTEYFSEFRRRVSCIPLSESVWQASKLSASQPNTKDKISAAVDFYVQYRQSRQGVGGDYTTPTKRTRRGMNEQVSSWLSAVDGLPECHQRLRRVEIRDLDFRDFIRIYDHPRSLTYCDPPYVHSTRSSTGEYGEHEMSDQDHADLLELLRGIQGKFMLSGYHSRLYDDFALRAGWNCHEKQIDNKASSSRTKEMRIECIWTNYGNTQTPSQCTTSEVGLRA